MEICGPPPWNSGSRRSQSPSPKRCFWDNIHPWLQRQPEVEWIFHSPAVDLGLTEHKIPKLEPESGSGSALERPGHKPSPAASPVWECFPLSMLFPRPQLRCSIPDKECENESGTGSSRALSGRGADPREAGNAALPAPPPPRCFLLTRGAFFPSAGTW